MLGFMGEPEALAFQRSMLLPGVDEAAMRATWQTATTAVGTLRAMPSRNAALRPLSAAAQVVAAELAAEDLFMRSFPGTSEWQSVEIDKLLAVQGYVDTEFVDSLTAPPQADEAEVLRFCMRPNPLEAPLLDVQGQVTFSSHFRNNLTNAGLAWEKVDENTYRVFATVVSRPNYMYVAEIHGSYILANGYHRAVALKRAGHTRVPCLLRHFTDYNQAFLPGTQAFSATHLAAARPPLVADFVNRHAGVVDFEMVGRAHIMRIGLIVSQFDAPR